MRDLDLLHTPDVGLPFEDERVGGVTAKSPPAGGAVVAADLRGHGDDGNDGQPFECLEGMIGRRGFDVREDCSE